jgi:hypothetical protein
MARTSRSWGYACWRLTARQIDRADRWGRVCTGAPKCKAQSVGAITWSYITGRRGRVATREGIVCETHLTRFAAKHELTIGDAPATEPAEQGGIIAAAVAAWDAAPEWVRIEPYGHGRNEWLVSRAQRNGLSVSALPIWLRDVPAGTPLEEALPALERDLGRRYGIVPARPWEIRQGGAHAPVVPAHTIPPWADVPWQVTVAADRHDIWQAVAVLDPRFRPDTTPLGNTNMTVARAVQAATIEMGDGWDLGEWTIHDQYATTTATRKQTINA